MSGGCIIRSRFPGEIRQAYERDPAFGNLLPDPYFAQRDYFGAHTYERTDRPHGEFFHTNWTGRGGDTAATIYNV